MGHHFKLLLVNCSCLFVCSFVVVFVVVVVVIVLSVFLVKSKIFILKSLWLNFTAVRSD